MKKCISCPSPALLLTCMSLLGIESKDWISWGIHGFLLSFCMYSQWMLNLMFWLFGQIANRYVLRIRHCVRCSGRYKGIPDAVTTLKELLVLLGGNGFHSPHSSYMIKSINKTLECKYCRHLCAGKWPMTLND